MRVALFTECYRPIVNGVTTSIESLREALVAHGEDVIVVAPFFPRWRDADDTVVRVRSLPLPTSTGYRLCVPYVPHKARARLRALDVVHAHSPFVTGWMARAHARAHHLPFVFTYHTRLDRYAHYAPFERETTRRVLAWLTRAFAQSADAVIVPTAAMERHLRGLGVRVPIAVVPSAIDVARIAAGRRSIDVRRMLGARDATPLVLSVARLGREKNVELAIDALVHLPQAVLAIAGDGPERRALAARAADRGVSERVRFCGALEPAALPDVYAAADALAFTSSSETQGLVLAEAMAAGLRIAAVDDAVNREVLDGAGVLSVPEPAAFAAALRAALSAGADPDGPARAARFSREVHARRMVDLYSAVHLAHRERTLGEIEQQLH